MFTNFKNIDNEASFETLRDKSERDPYEYSKKENKITKWKNEPSISTLINDLELAKNNQIYFKNKIDKWSDIREIEGSKKIIPIEGRSKVQPKLVRRQLEWRYPSLSEPFHSTTKLFNILPVTFEDAEAAKQNTLLLNWQFRTYIDKVKFLDDLVHGLVDEGTAIVAVSWVQETEEVEVEVPEWAFYEADPMDQEYFELISQLVEQKEANPRFFEEEVPEELKTAVSFFEETGQIVRAEITGYTKETQETVKENYPTVDVIDPRNIYVDPTCNGNYEKAMFIIQAYETSYADLIKQKDLYHNLDKINWEGTAEKNDDSYTNNRNSSEENFRDKSRRKIIAYDYWGYYDIEGNGKLVPIIATWIGNTIIRMEENPYPFKKPPFAIINYIPIKRSIYGETDAELLEDNQDIMGAVYRGMLDLLSRSANSQVGTPTQWLDPINEAKFNKGENFKYNLAANIDPSKAVVQYTYPEFPNSAMQMISLMNQESEALTAIKSFSGGINSNAFGNLATGARMATDATAKREMSIVRRIANGVKKVGEMLTQMNMHFLTKEEVIRVTNRKFITVTPEDIKGNFDLEVDIATAEVDAEKASNIGFVLQTTGQNLHPQLYNKLMGEIFDLQKMPEFAEEIRSFRPEPSPEELELQQLELELKRLEVEKLRSEVEFNLARAKKANSEAELEDLNFVEQETGTKHAREVDKAKAQARGNMELEVLKASLNNYANKDNIPTSKRTNPINELSQIPETPEERELWKLRNPSLSLSSDKYDSRLDPARNLAIQLS